MAGSQMTDDEALKFMRNKRLDVEFCLVRDWTWIDLDVSPAQLADLEKTRRKPAIIFARRVIYDSQRRWDVGDLVRTSPLQEFRDGCLFLTLNSVYVLLGNGQKKQATLETVGRIVF